jgi:dTDP-4-amino-4,6-dideoxygalactose transaminase
VHLWGRPAPISELQAVAARHSVPLLFDAAHALGSTYSSRPIGAFGTAEVFSFHGTKAVHTFEGGAVTTNDGDLASRLRLLRNFGFEDYDRVVSVGINAKMSEVGAAMGLTLIEDLDLIIAARRRAYGRYDAGLDTVTGVDLLPHPVGSGNYQYVVVEVDEAQTGLTRDELQRTLWAENVLARRYFYPGCHRMEPYRTLDSAADARLPQTNRVASRVLCLPTGAGVRDHEADRVCELIGLALENAAAVRDRLAREPS